RSVQTRLREDEVRAVGEIDRALAFLLRQPAVDRAGKAHLDAMEALPFDVEDRLVRDDVAPLDADALSHHLLRRRRELVARDRVFKQRRFRFVLGEARGVEKQDNSQDYEKKRCRHKCSLLPHPRSVAFYLSTI